MKGIGAWVMAAAVLAAPVARAAAAAPWAADAREADMPWRLDPRPDDPNLSAVETLEKGGQVGFIFRCNRLSSGIFWLTIARSVDALTPAQIEAARTAARGFTLLPDGGSEDDHVVTVLFDDTARFEKGKFITLSGNVPRGRLRGLIASGHDVWAWVNAEEAYTSRLGETYDLPLEGLAAGLQRLEDLCAHLPNVAPVAPPAVPAERPPAKP